MMKQKTFKSYILITALVAFSLPLFAKLESKTKNVDKEEIALITSERGGDYAWYHGVCLQLNDAPDIPNSIIRDFESAKSLCPELESYDLVSLVYQEIKDMHLCEAIDLKEQKKGSCVSQKGGRFQRVYDVQTGEWGILDLLEDGKLWLDKMYINKRFKKAVEKCNWEKDEKVMLPSVEDFYLAEERGFREAFAGDMKNEFLWSATEASSRYAYYFNGTTGKVLNHGYKPGYQVARCVKDVN